MEPVMEQANIRYVHVKDLPIEYGDVNGYTIAYYRTRQVVYFAWSTKIRSDQYIKEIGRTIATNRLNLIDFEMVDDAWDYKVSVDFDMMIGVVHVSHLTQNLDEFFADQFVAEIDMFSFKHSAISAVLTNIVIHQEF